MKKILFVCIGNMCRSPLAAAIGSKMFENCQFESAGISSDGYKAAPYTINVVKELYNIDISTHRTRNIYYLDADAYSHIIALDASVYRDLINVLVGKKIILWDVADPYTKSSSAYTECAKAIEKKFKENEWLFKV